MFSARFLAVLTSLNLTTVELITAFVRSGVQFAHAVLDLAPAMTQNLNDEDALRFHQEVTDFVEQFAVLWILVIAAKDSFLKDSARTFGFGQANQAVSTARRPSLPPAKMLRGVQPIAASSAAYKVSVQQSAALTPLMEEELMLKSKWIALLVWKPLQLQPVLRPSSTTQSLTMLCCLRSVQNLRSSSWPRARLEFLEPT